MRSPTARAASLGAAVREARTDAQLTLSDVADEVGCSTSHVHYIETGQRDGVGFFTMLKLCDVLGLDPWEIAERPSEEMT